MTALAEEWHGDYWVPPFRQHSSLRARQLLDNKTVLVAGDSITRQFGATLALFLLRPFQHAKGIETEALLGARPPRSHTRSVSLRHCAYATLRDTDTLA